MKRSPSAVYGALILSVLALGFCLWVKTGNSFDICFTEGCTLYADASIGGVSLWWLGALTFFLLGGLALFRLPGLGRLAAGAALCCDLCLLALMAFTAPCFNCLVVACFYLAVYLSFRRACRPAQSLGAGRRSLSLLALAWTVLFLFNAGAVLKSFAGVWAVNENLEHAKVHFFFSPSCPACRKGVDALAGKVDVAFLPVAESPRDLARIRIMARELHNGSNILEALAKSEAAAEPSLLDYLDREMLAVKFRVLRNQAHVFQAGSQKVPFVEYHNLPPHLAKAADARAQAQRQTAQAPVRPSPRTQASLASPAQQTPSIAPAQPAAPAASARPAPRRPQASPGGDPSLPFEGGSDADACQHNAPCSEESAGTPGQDFGGDGAFQRRRP